MKLKNRGMKKEDKINEIVIIVVLLGLFLIAYLLLFYPRTCKQIACFNEALVKCKPVKFVKETNEASWLYVIKSRIKDSCIVNVKILQIKQGSLELKIIENKDMDCYLPLETLETIVVPTSDLSKCHGVLKEEIQSLVMQKMHKYIIENLGEIKTGIGNLSVGNVTG